MGRDIVRVENLVKRYGERAAVDHLSFRVAPGEAFGLLGPNGSGKSTTLMCLLQVLSFDGGSVELFGERMAPDRADLKARIGVVPQEVAVFEELTVRENVDAFCGLYVAEPAHRRALVDAALDFTGLSDFARMRPRKLSGGLVRRLNIACGIAHGPELLILDEPTVAVDPQSRNAILDGIAQLRERGTTIIYTSHYMEEVERLCSRIMIMDAGRALAEGSADELKGMVGIGERIRIEAASPDEGLAARLRALPCARSVELIGSEYAIECQPGPHNLADVLAAFAEVGAAFGKVSCTPPSLNDVFLEMTGRALRDEA